MQSNGGNDYIVTPFYQDLCIFKLYQTIISYCLLFKVKEDHETGCDGAYM